MEAGSGRQNSGLDSQDRRTIDNLVKWEWTWIRAGLVRKVRTGLQEGRWGQARGIRFR